MNEELISIIVPVYNVEKYLKRCVDSIVNQTYKNLEIILVNDGSKDSSLDVCQELAKQDKRIVVFDKKNEGLSATRNFGIKHAKGKWLSFIDSDDYIELDMIQTLYVANKTNNTKIASGGRYDVFENDDKKTVGLCPKKDEVINSEEAIKRLLMWQDIDSSACDKLFATELWSNISFPEGRISEDVAIMHHVFDKSKQMSLVSKPFYCYFHRANSITTSSFSEKSLNIIDNVKSIELFVLNNYPNLSNAFLFFKGREYSSLLGMMAKSKKRYKDIEKELISGLKECKSIFNLFTKKEKTRAILFSNKCTYSLYRFLFVFKRS